MTSTIKSWIKKPENIAYLLLMVVCLVVAGMKYNVGIVGLVLVLMGLSGFLIRRLFFRE
jgi:hypothetical protein